MVARSAFASVAVLFALSHCAIDDRDLEEHDADDSSNGGNSNGGTRTGGTSSGGTASGTGGTGALPADCQRDADDDDCYACWKASCCDQYQGCFASSECLYFVSCAADCADLGCLDACVVAYPGGAQLYDDFANCGDARCTDAC